MTGPEHHAKAEQLLEEAHTAHDHISRSLLLAEAQVHATLALASATAAKDTPAAHDTRAPGHQESSPARQSQPIGSTELTDHEYAEEDREERRNRAPWDELPQRGEIRPRP